ncbi:hypothetical protein GCM10009122_11510 [Fulvivirga kasyanovii]|uniref:Uncharacterized protein n=1 Tax=Fulvivirga kasyanovii TaxID=396812 RepID=A0ABW9RUB8_9BACT|nr:hypothetical protein [Fulvivirga kasyanovii]MTI26838.1 hypothetical protein [Fulvivirga kasyanovii]
MKKIKMNFNLPMAILTIGMAVFTITSCQEDALTDKDKNDMQLTQDQANGKRDQNARYGGGICFPVVEPGRIVRVPFGFDCINNWGGCNRYYVECLPWLDPCALIPCGIEWRDPWIIYEKFREIPEDFESFRDAGQIEIDPSNTMAYFPVNDHVLGMQFYEEWEHSLSQDKLHLRTSVVLDDETASDYGLAGNVLPAGIYPVIFNEKNGTFNAFTSVNKFPVKYDRPITQIIPGDFDGSLNLLLKDFDLKEHPESVVIEEDIELYVVEPNLSDNIEGVYAISPNLYDLTLVFKGDPNPQPSKFDPTPTPLKIRIEEEIWLNEEIASLLNIEPFLIKPENVHQAYDEEADVLRVTILR